MKQEDQAELEQEVEETDEQLADRLLAEKVARQLIEDGLNTLLGKPEAEVVKQLQDAGWKVRITARDGQSFMGTMDFRTDRVKLQVQNGVITKIYVG